MSCGCGKGGSGSMQANSSDCANSSCGQTLIPGCAQQNCNCGCGCNPSQQVSPTPFYCKAPGVQECHQEVIIQSQYVTGVTTATSFNMPACQQTSTIIIPGLQKISIGSFLWNPVYGYLEVMSFDYANSLVVVKNNCNNLGQAAPGTTIPSCTLFTVTDPPLSGINSGPASLYPFLAIDFVAPAIGDCLVVNVTNTNGLAIGQNATIGGGIYAISGIPNGSQIEICNGGSGVTPGSTVVALDGLGNYITPIILVNASPCANTSVPQGALMVCKNGVMQPLDAIATNMVPVVTDATTNEVTFQALDLPTRVCTVLTVCLNLQIGVASYIITVTSSAEFILGDKLYIGTDLSHIYTITNINPDGVHMTVTIDPVPLAFSTLQPGTSVCWVGCCEQTSDLVDSLGAIKVNPCLWTELDKLLYSRIGFLDSLTDPNQAGMGKGGMLIPESGAFLLTTPYMELYVANTTCSLMAIEATATYSVACVIDSSNAGLAVARNNAAQIGLNLLPYWGYAAGAIGSVISPVPISNIEHYRNIVTVVVPSVDINTHHMQWMQTLSYTLLPGQEIRIGANVGVERTIDNVGGSTTAGMIARVDGGAGDRNTLRCILNLIGVAARPT